MKIDRAIEVLYRYSRWRKGDDIPLKDLKQVTEAVDLAVSVMKKVKHHALIKEI